MVKIRLRRVGARKQPSYRVVVTDSRTPRNGAFIEIIGNYNPRTSPETVVIKEEKARLWLSRGAQPTDTVARLLAKAGIIERRVIERPKASAAKEPKPETKEKSETVEKPKDKETA